MTLVTKNKTKTENKQGSLRAGNSVLSSMFIAFTYLISREMLLSHFKTKETGLRKVT